MLTVFYPGDNISRYLKFSRYGYHSMFLSRYQRYIEILPNSTLKAAVPPARMSSGTNNTIAGCHDMDNVPLVSLASEVGRVTHQFMY